MTERSAKRLARDVKRRTLIAENIAPTASSRRLTVGISAEGDASCTGDGNQPRLFRRGAGERNHRIVGHLQLQGAEYFVDQRLLVGGSAAEPQACSVEFGFNRGLF